MPLVVPGSRSCGACWGGNVAEFRLDYRVDIAGGVRVMEAREVEALGLWGAVRAVEVCLVLRGDAQAQYQSVMDVLDLLGRIGLNQVGLATKPLVK